LIGFVDAPKDKEQDDEEQSNEKQTTKDESSPNSSPKRLTLSKDEQKVQLKKKFEKIMGTLAEAKDDSDTSENEKGDDEGERRG
jgi:hypothetical protein